MPRNAYFQVGVDGNEPIINEPVNFDGNVKDRPRRLFRPDFRWLDNVTEVVFLMQPSSDDVLGLRVLSSRPLEKKVQNGCIESGYRQRSSLVVDGQPFYPEPLLYNHLLSRVGQFRIFDLVNFNGFEVLDRDGMACHIAARLEIQDELAGQEQATLSHVEAA